MEGETKPVEEVKIEEIKPEQPKPQKGSCPICFTKYYFRMKAEKVGKDALKGVNGLRVDDFETNYRDLKVILSSRSFYAVSICKDCYIKLNDDLVKTAFENQKLIDIEDTMASRMSEEDKTKGVESIKQYTYVFWNTNEEEIKKKYAELFPE